MDRRRPLGYWWRRRWERRLRPWRMEWEDETAPLDPPLPAAATVLVFLENQQMDSVSSVAWLAAQLRR